MTGIPAADYPPVAAALTPADREAVPVTETAGPELTQASRAFAVSGAVFDTVEDVTGHDFV
ncbi:hypothetical protein, partial [Streptomyces sp. NPDC102476]|uniref:hypothetical protein n=1 Tax=Streptomyces sp. NPDC102476 TaxID=3366181 RepID=UPI0037FC9F9D